MHAFFRFIASPAGQLTRIVAGIALIAVGLGWVQGTGGWVLIIVALIPLVAGLFDRCVFAPLVGLPFVGWRLRRALEDKQHA